MLKALPGVFAAGEMLDWEAPTGGYLLQACFATGVAAAKGVLARLAGSGLIFQTCVQPSPRPKGAKTTNRPSSRETARAIPDREGHGSRS